MIADLSLGSLVTLQWLNSLKARAWQNVLSFFGGILTSAGTGYASHLESELYFNNVPATFSAYFAANMKAGASGTIYAQLYDLTSAAAISGSEISSTSSADYERKTTAATVSIPYAHRVCVQTKHATAAGTIANPRLIII